jgi:ABC-type uncharacterized transport system permease subunit
MASMALNFGALLALLPAFAAAYRRDPRPDALFFALLGLGTLGPILWVASQASGAWRTGFAMSLWITIGVTMGLFLLLSLRTRYAWQLAPLLLPYLVLLGFIALIWQRAPERPISENVPAAWLDTHIVFAVATYGLLTLGAVAGLAVFLQERALKSKKPTPWLRLLPPMAESEALELRLLVAAEAVLSGGLASGMAAEHFLGGKLLPFDHKTLLSLAAFLLIGALLFARYRQGLRGRRAARLVLLAYLLLTLAYPGVKFVTDVLIG